MCDFCGKTQTPCWRKGPLSHPQLCNACGAYYLNKRSLAGRVCARGAQAPQKKVATVPTAKLVQSQRSTSRNPKNLNSAGLKRKQPEEEIICELEKPESPGEPLTGKRARRPNPRYTANDSKAEKGAPLPSVGAARGPPSSSHSQQARLVAPRPPKPETAAATPASKKKVPQAPPAKLATKPATGSRERAATPTPKKIVSQVPLAKPETEPEIGVRDSAALPGPKKNLPQSPGKPALGNAERDAESAPKPTPSKALPSAKNDVLERYPYVKRDVLTAVESPIAHINLADVINADTFTRHFTAEEQRELAQHVGCVDLPQASGNSKGEPVASKLFACAQFQDALGNFKNLLSSGMFDPSSAACSSRMMEHYTKLTSITDLASEHWHEKLPLLALRSRRRGGPAASSVEWKEAYYERCWGEKTNMQVAGVEPSSAGCVQAVKEAQRNPLANAYKKEAALSEEGRPLSDDATAAPEGVKKVLLQQR